jgi:hypothetical protein
VCWSSFSTALSESDMAIRLPDVVREKTMFDALFYAYIVIVNMKQSGHFPVVAAMRQQIEARCRALRDATMLMWNGTAAEAIAGAPQRTGCISVICPAQKEWTELLGRLETYVASIA